MSTEPLTFLRDHFPELFAQGVTALEERAAAGSERARLRLDDIRQAHGAACVHLEGDGTVWFRVEGGSMTVVDERPEGVPVHLAVAVPAAAAKEALSEAERSGDLAGSRAALIAASTASARVQKALAGQKLLFHIIVTEVPDLGDVTIRVGLNAEAPPEHPGFTATLRYEVLEDLREGAVDPQQLFLGGKVRFGGDYGPALQLGMQLMQAR